MVMAEQRLILVVVDGLRWDTALAYMPHLNGLVLSGKAARGQLQAGLPTLSRPCYETICTGISSEHHGITDNMVQRPSRFLSIFHCARTAGLTTGAAAYHWFNDLYDRAIEHTDFYDSDDYPDADLFAAADRIEQIARPDLLLVHPMGVDTAGHRYGGESRQYRQAAAQIDRLLSPRVRRWLEDPGVTVLITSDHGMGADGTHGGDAPELTAVPFYAAGAQVRPGIVHATYHQTDIAPTVCRLLGVPPSPVMKRTAMDGFFQSSRRNVS